MMSKQDVSMIKWSSVMTVGIVLLVLFLMSDISPLGQETGSNTQQLIETLQDLDLSETSGSARLTDNEAGTAGEPEQENEELDTETLDPETLDLESDGAAPIIMTLDENGNLVPAE